ncbi:Hypothetical protein D9617_20g028750 [Elsinoe fawcettii]|nr:Hypothetical protein D9617_20g028750 [Elsinoe fawcettii]
MPITQIKTEVMATSGSGDRRLLWEAKENKQGKDSAHAWDKGHPHGSAVVPDDVLDGEDAMDGEVVVHVGDWIIVRYSQSKEAGAEFAKVCAIKEFSDDKGNKDIRFCICWGAALKELDIHTDKLKFRIKEVYKLDKTSIVLSDWFDIIDITNVARVVRQGADHNGVVTAEDTRGKKRSDVQICQTIYVAGHQFTEIENRELRIIE